MRKSRIRVGHSLTQALVLLLALVVFLPVALASQETSSADAKLERLSLQAQEAQARSDYRTAAARYQEMLNLRPDLAEARANLGLMHHLLGEYKQAIREFEASLRQKPRLFVPNLFLGLDYLRTQQPRRALSYLHGARELNPRDRQALLGLGQAYAALGEYSQANDWYSQAVRVDSTNADALYGLGMSYLKLVSATAEQIGEIGPKSVYARALLAESFEQRGYFRDAVKVYEQIVESPSTIPCLYAALGFAYLQSGDISSAEQQFRRQLEGDSSCLLGRLGLARVALERGDVAGALRESGETSKADSNFLEQNADSLWLGLEHEKEAKLESRLREIAATEPGAALARVLLSALERTRRGMGDGSAESTEAFSGGRSAGQRPDKPPAPPQATPVSLLSQGHYSLCTNTLKSKQGQLSRGNLLLLAQCAYYSGDYRTSFLASGAATRVAPEDLAGLYWRVKAGERLALRTLVAAGIAEPNSSRMHVLLGDAYFQKRDYKAAEAEYRRAIQLKPDDAAGHLGLAATYYRQMKFDVALPELRRVFALDPRHAEASYIMADILIFRQQYTEALPYLSAALNGEPSTLPHVHALLGKAYAAEGRMTEAVAELKQSLMADRDGSYHYQLYQAYKKLGDQKAAASALQRSETLRRNKIKNRDTALDPSP